MKFRLNRALVSVVTTVALLLALVAGVAQLRGRAASAVPAAPASSVGASPGDYRLSPPNEAEPAGASVGVTSPTGNVPGFTDFRESHSADAPADRPGRPAVPTDPGVGPSEYLPGEAAVPGASEDSGTACRQLAGCDR